MLNPLLALPEERAEKIREAQTIAQVAKAKGRQLTNDEIRKCDSLLAEADALLPKIAAAEQAAGASAYGGRMTTTNEIGTIGACGFDAPAKAKRKLETWKSAKGKTITVLGKGDKFSDLPASEGYEGIDPSEYSLGRLIVGSVTGNWTGPEERFAMGGVIQSAGGAAVPEPLAREFIDAARARSVMFEAGMRTIPMDSATLDIARVTSDATFNDHAENETIGSSDLTLDRVQLTATKFGTVVKASRELIADAPNASRIIEGALAQAWAAKLDNLILQGGAGDGITGLQNSTDVTESAGVGAIAWSDVSTAIQTVQLADHQPNAMILGPATLEDLEVILVAAEASHFGPGPTSAEALPKLVSTNCNTADAFIGDFTSALLGVRRDMEIAVSSEAGTSFADDQVWIRLTWRGDMRLEFPNSIHRLVGLTH